MYDRVQILLYKFFGILMIKCQTKQQAGMRRHSIVFVLVLSIMILSYVAEHEVTAAASPEPCFFDFPFRLPRRRRPKDDDDNKPDKDKEKKKQEKIPKKIIDQLKKDFNSLISLF
ncbi:uncharacterized protein LOC133519841 isoform X2 [Cydia pomonella]|uniref:uncharacterized protein LOC133519841 isoform X2 n=1 Tax=Cydia pomonella TaxID=82600 RepID=UPI002ADD61BF|nr:uncharacterized protein LOC133519841 isoform X2 [Cydia pomonella]